MAKKLLSIKLPSESEKKNLNIARKSIHLLKDVKAGDILSIKDLTVKRPGYGLSPLLINEVKDCIVKTDLDKDTMLRFEDIEWK